MSRQAETSKYHLLKSVKIQLFRERLSHLSLNNATIWVTIALHFTIEDQGILALEK